MVHYFMRMRKKIWMVLIIIPVLLAGIGIFFLMGGEEPHFYRVDHHDLIKESKYFSTNKEQGRLFFKKSGKKFRLDGIPTLDGCYFFLKGKKQIKIKPRMRGDVGFYSFVHFRGLRRKDVIDMSIRLYSQGKSREVYRVATRHMAQPVFSDLSIKKSDMLVFQFKGRGAVYFSPPLLYRKAPAIEPSKRRLVIMIGGDTFRGDQVGAKVNGVPLTPNIEAFAKDAVRFDNAIAQTSWTLPSFMSLFTGLNEYNHGVGIKHALPLDKPFLVQNLAKEFITIGFHGGKVMNPRWGFSRGFDYYKHFAPAGALYPRGGRHVFNKGIETLKEKKFPDLFLFLHTYQVHAPYAPPLKYLHRLNKKPRFERLDIVNVNKFEKTYLPVREDKKRALMELYQAEILAFDAFFGEFTAKLKKMELYDDAMIILLSDHGEEFFEHNGWGHSHSIYNEQVHVPLLIKFPKSKFKDKRIRRIVGLVDVMPTVLSYFNIKYPQRLDGENLMPLLTDGHIERKKHVVTSISTGRNFDILPPRIAIFEEPYKLIYNEAYTRGAIDFYKKFAKPPIPPRFQLFNLSQDPGENNNTARSHKKIKDRLMKILIKSRNLMMKRIAELGKSKKEIDSEARKHLKSLGYL